MHLYAFEGKLDRRERGLVLFCLWAMRKRLSNKVWVSTRRFINSYIVM